MKTSALAGVFALALLVAGCGGDNLGVSGKVEAGSERAVNVSNSLPPAATGAPHDPAVAPADETRGVSRIGSIIADSGGQKAQKGKEEKEAAAEDAKAREARTKAEAEEAEHKAAASSAPEQAKAPEPPAGPPTEAQAPTPPAAVRSNVLADAETTPPPPQPAPAPAQAAEPPAATTPPPVAATPPPVAAAPAPSAAQAKSVAATSTPEPSQHSETAPPSAANASVLFAMDSAEINDEARAELDRVAKAANARGVRQIELRAYARGSDDVESRKVALARALAVRSYLIDDGVKARIEVGTFGPADKATDPPQRVDLVAPGL